jgi:uncharacterized protein YjbJ (UPF0337 family)
MPDKNVIEGQIKNIEGHVEEVVGDLVDNPRLKAEGIAKQIQGKAQETVGHLKDAGRSATNISSK